MGNQSFKVNIPQLDTINGVFKLQTGHLGKLRTYIQTNCNAGSGFTGLAVAPLQGHYDRAYQAADTGTGQGKSISENAERTMASTKAEYLRQDRAAYDKFAAEERRAGRTPPPYRPPGAGPAPTPGTSIAGAKSGDDGWYKMAKKIDGEVNRYAGYADKARALGPFGPGLERPKAPEYPDNLNPAKWREYVIAKRLYDARMNRLDDGTARAHNERNTGGNTSWTREDAARVRQEGYERGRTSARDDMWSRVDWAEADRRNGADTTGNSSYTGDDMRAERETRYANPAPQDRSGETWDGNKTAGAATRALGLPGTVASTVEGGIQALDRAGDAQDLYSDVTASERGPSNTESNNWANKGGGTW